MTDKEFQELQELLKSLGIKDEKENHKTIDKYTTIDELKKLAGKIIFSMAQDED